MNRWIMIVVMAILLVVGCAERVKPMQPTMWLLSGANVAASDAENEIEDTLEYVGRIGLRTANTELGVASDWWMGSDPRQSYGVYAVQFLTDPNGLLGTLPYAGVQATLDIEDESSGMYGFVAGTIIPIKGLDVVTEFQARRFSEVLDEKMTANEDEYKVFVGLRIPIP